MEMSPNCLKTHKRTWETYLLQVTMVIHSMAHTIELIMFEENTGFFRLWKRPSKNSLFSASWRASAESGIPSSTNCRQVGILSQSRQNARLFLQSSELGLSPTPSPAGLCAPPPLFGSVWRDTLSCGRGGWRVLIPSRGQTLWYSRYICTLWLIAMHSLEVYSYIGF
jgi:hypothetical protein